MVLPLDPVMPMTVMSPCRRSSREVRAWQAVRAPPRRPPPECVGHPRCGSPGTARHRCRARHRQSRDHRRAPPRTRRTATRGARLASPSPRTRRWCRRRPPAFRPWRWRPIGPRAASSCSSPFGLDACVGRQVGVTVVVAVEHPGDLLGGLVALAGDDHGVSGLRRAAARIRPPPRAARPRAHRRDPGRTFSIPSRMAARIAAGSSERGFSSVSTMTSASLRRNLAHDGALALVAVAIGAEDQDQAARRDGPHALERERQRVRRVRVVDDRERVNVAALDDALHAAGNLMRRRHAVDRGVERHACRVGRHDRHRRVGDVDEARQRAFGGVARRRPGPPA